MHDHPCSRGSIAALTGGPVRFVGADELEPTLIRLDPDVSADEFFAAVDAAFGNDERPPEGSALGLPGDIIGLFHDFGSTSTFFVAVDLSPGTYELIAADSDAE